MGPQDAVTLASCQGEVIGIFTSSGVDSDVKLEYLTATREVGEWRK